MKKITIIALISICSFGVNAQEETQVKNEYPATHHIGLHVGSTTGLGFSYRYWPQRLGVQITGIPVFNQGGGNFVSLGVTGLYSLTNNRNKYIDAYAYLGNHYISRKSVFGLDPQGNPTSFTRTNYNVGLGVGIKINMWNVMDFNVQTGYAVYDVTNTPFTMLAGEMGFYYHF